MGTVFEAEETDSGRRVAIKLLSRALDTPETHARFLREGRLAASINHPNSVYVFGTEEVRGTPVILMELVPGGTLKDQVSTRGPLPSGEAVDALLQVIDGLECAYRQGILHRDIKPSNCFVDSDGTVKIGDFGLSVSLGLEAESSLTLSGTFIGTPAYSSPEQLRGEKLTLSSDIYAVGLTLYYLLTGRLPFEAPNTIQLLARILERQPDPPSRFSPGLPRGLDAVVLRCLEKDPELRFKDYAGLRDALSVYSAASATPANPGLRFVAGVGDALVLGSVQAFTTSLWLGGWPGVLRPDIFDAPKLGLALTTSWILGTAYYGLSEGLWGRSAGKAACRLRVVREGGQPISLPRALARAGLFCLTSFLPQLVFWGVCQLSDSPLAQSFSSVASLGPIMLTLVLFAPARRSNGFAAVHDQLLKARVVAMPNTAVRHGPSASRTAEKTPPHPTLATLDPTTPPRVGPYDLVRRLAGHEHRGLWLGSDPRLQRSVWLHRQPVNTPPISVQQRQLGRPGRLRWLGGRRTPTEAWDAYEALDGRPLLEWLNQNPDWGQVRLWARDLVAELQMAERDGSTPDRLALDQVWITARGSAKLLDFPIPGLDSVEDGPGSRQVPPTEFLRSLARAALSSMVGLRRRNTPSAGVQPIPLHAQAFLEQLVKGVALETAARELRDMLGRPAAVTRLRRFALLVGCMTLPLLGLILGTLGAQLLKTNYRQNLEVAVLQTCLYERSNLEAEILAGRSDLIPVREAFDVYIAGRSGPLMTNQATWNAPGAMLLLARPHRQLAESILAREATPASDALTEAEVQVRRRFGRAPDQAALERIDRIRPSFMALVFAGWTVLLVSLSCWMASVLFRGGALFHLAGLALVTRDGRLASRGRVLWRNLLAWLPASFALFAPFMVGPRMTQPGAILGLLAGLSLLALLSAVVAQRNLPDRLAGTYVVPK